MAKSPEIPLQLYQVLEEEYISLHGPIPASEVMTVKLPGEGENGWRDVKATRGWRFWEGHIKDPVGFASALLLHIRTNASKKQQPEDSSPTMQDDQSSDPAGKLKDYLCTRIRVETLQEIEMRRNAPAAELKPFVEQLASELNEILYDNKNYLYQPERFDDDWLSDTSSELVALHQYEPLHGDKLAQLNRLLLEAAFPTTIEKVHNIRMAAIQARFHIVRQTALCLSGGGIRSGTFALGLLQGLARHKLLEKFTYLSTVSGGGYIGGWLSAWIHRHPKGLKGVTDELANSTPSSKIDPDPKPVQYLRQYSNFITPKVGLLTADTWTFLGIYLRNLLLNWMVFIPLLISVLVLPRILLALTLMQPANPGFWRASIFGWTKDFYVRHIFLTLGFIFGIWALGFIGFNRPGVRERLKKNYQRLGTLTDQKWFLALCLVPLILSATFLTTFWAWSQEVNYVGKDWWKFAVFGALFTFFGWLIYTVILRRVISWWELILLLIVGALGGLAFWLLSLHGIGKPVIGYLGDPPFPFTKWNGWIAWKTELYVCLAVPLFLLVFWLATAIFVGVSSQNPLFDDEDREWWSRSSAWVLISILVWVFFNALMIFGPIALLDSPRVLASLGGISGLIALLVGRSSRTPASPDQEAKGGLVSSLMGSLLPLLALVFIAIFIAAMSLAISGIIQGLFLLTDQLLNQLLKNIPDIAGWLDPLNREVLTKELSQGTRKFAEWFTNAEPFAEHIRYTYGGISSSPALEAAKLVHMNVLHHTSFWFLLVLAVLMFVIGIRLARRINLNLFSLHGGYRNRLIRAFLGASRPEGERRPNPFTGFDPSDNLYMHELRPGLLAENDLIDPRRLAASLKSNTDLLSQLLLKHDLLEKAKSEIDTYDSISTPSPRLIAALREDLNRALESDRIHLYDEPSLKPLLETPHAQRAQKDIEESRTERHIRLNRLVLEQAYPDAIRQAQYPPPPHRLMHVINTSLNLVGGDNLAWQQRKAEPFSITPLHCGCYRLGYRRSRDYGGKATGGISIGTAAAISGAAASSNMGYYTTSPVISLLLTLFNVRLGWWLGNPGPAGSLSKMKWWSFLKKSRDFLSNYSRHFAELPPYLRGSPEYSVAPIIKEAFGLTNDSYEYVYLTDGGHFENLALYEMVLRRCHIIVASDGAQDEKYHFGDLGNAVRKIRIDLGVPIEFANVPIYARSPEGKGKGMYWAIGKIRYKCIDGPGSQDGILLYIKPAVYGNEPRDILEYKKNFPAFPHQSTGDQFFDEPQFESYRMLGSHVMDQLCGEGTDELDLYTMINKAIMQLTEDKDKSAVADPQLGELFEDWLDSRNQITSAADKDKES